MTLGISSDFSQMVTDTVFLIVSVPSMKPWTPNSRTAEYPQQRRKSIEVLKTVYYGQII